MSVFQSVMRQQTSLPFSVTTHLWFDCHGGRHVTSLTAVTLFYGVRAMTAMLAAW